MPYVEQSSLDSAWTDFDSKQGGAGILRPQFEEWCWAFRHGPGKARRNKVMARMASYGTVDPVVLANLIPRVLAHPER